MDWHDSDLSEEDANVEAQSSSRKRSSRACDQCRKTKSKCERSRDGAPCKSCAIVGTACTFLGPSYKRGPPKGYIHAIEQRWHQVESLLGAIIQCPDPRVQGIVSDLRQDDLAREIINRVDMGPYGPSGRLHEPAGATKEDFFASILRSNENRDPARAKRQSRVSREIVSSNQDNGLSVVPTAEWQDNLSRRLASSVGSHLLSDSLPSSSHVTFDHSGEPLAQRRRLASSATEVPHQPDWNGMYTFDSTLDHGDTDDSDTAQAFGQLSLDENQEVRYHSKASGLHILGNRDRTDDRREGGIWKMPMARVWPPSKHRLTQLIQEDDVDVELPPVDVQDKLIQLYFVYIHPSFPVIHKKNFLAQYAAKKLRDANGDDSASPAPSTASSSSTPRPESSLRLSKLLLLSMFAVAARYSESEMPLPPKGKMWEAGCNYLASAQNILTKIYHQSRPSTVQALLLLGHREFGIGSMELAWIYIGMAIRMAIDLGLNCNSDLWKVNGLDLFAADEKQSRRQIWWACCIADRYGSIYMGRPVSIRDGDYNTPLPDLDQDEENEPWMPLPSDPIKINYVPVPGRVMSVFRAAARLAIIVGSIITMVYPVRPTTRLPRRTLLAGLESQLDQWYIDLPEHLRYDTMSKRSVPTPNILLLHLHYWGAVLLLNRAFIPNWKGTEELSRNPPLETDTIGLKAFDLSQSAASHISSIVTVYHETYSLKRISPFLSAYLLATGTMHTLTLTLRPSNVQASLGFQQCLTALKELEVPWPSASRAWDLLHGVKLGFDSRQVAPVAYQPDRQKRHAEVAFGQEKSSDYLQREVFGATDEEQVPASPDSGSSSANGVQDLNTRLMAHMLGLDIPGIQPSTSYYPGYEWWPRGKPDGASALPSPSLGLAPYIPNNMSVTDSMVFDTEHGSEDWLHGGGIDTAPSFIYDFSPSQRFGA